MMGMKIIPSVFLDKMRDMETSKIVEEFDFFNDDLPHLETFLSELLQWRVSKSLKSKNCRDVVGNICLLC